MANANANILVVDDEPHVRFFLQQALTRVGHTVVEAESGQQALALSKTHAFDLALVDLKLGDISGMEVLSALRQHTPDTVVIMLTAYASLESAVEALRQGAHDYLFKPCKTVELRESVRTGLLRRQQMLRQRTLLTELNRIMLGQDAQPPQAQASALLASTGAPTNVAQEAARFLKHGALVVDFMRHVVTLGEQRLELSPTEFDILAYLLSAAPRIVSPQELIREVQGYECEPWEASELLRYHIHRLRQKIKEATGRTDIIDTKRGLGYAISDSL
jgi:DNA-binding response OmpR family regulator